MQQILVDRRELVAQRLVEIVDDLGVAFHARLLWLRWSGPGDGAPKPLTALFRLFLSQKRGARQGRRDCAGVQTNVDEDFRPGGDRPGSRRSRPRTRRASR